MAAQLPTKATITNAIVLQLRGRYGQVLEPVHSRKPQFGWISYRGGQQCSSGKQARKEGRRRATETAPGGARRGAERFTLGVETDCRGDRQDQDRRLRRVPCPQSDQEAGGRAGETDGSDEGRGQVLIKPQRHQVSQVDAHQYG